MNLSPYLVTGQQILKYYMTWTTLVVSVLPAGTTSDTVSFDPAGVVIYVFPNNCMTEYSAPMLSVRLADVPNATGFSVQYAYNPYFFRPVPRWSALPIPSTYCGAGACSLPVDRNIGTVYYRVLYLNSSNQVLATSDLQTM